SRLAVGSSPSSPEVSMLATTHQAPAAIVHQTQVLVGARSETEATFEGAPKRAGRRTPSTPSWRRRRARWFAVALALAATSGAAFGASRLVTGQVATVVSAPASGLAPAPASALAPATASAHETATALASATAPASASALEPSSSS